MKNEMVNILAEDLEDGVAIRVGVQRVEYQPGTVGPWAPGVADEPFAIIKQGNDRLSCRTGATGDDGLRRPPRTSPTAKRESISRRSTHGFPRMSRRARTG